MNLGLITSYVVGGILLIAILSMNMSVSTSSAEITFTQTIREKASGIQEFISHDIQKMGYNRTKKTNPVLVSADSNLIEFHSNIDNSPDGSAEVIKWEFTGTPVSSTPNPNDYELVRSVKDTATGTVNKNPIRLGVTNFNIKYLDKYGEDLSNHLSPPLSSSQMSDVKQLYIELELQTGEEVIRRGGDGRYLRTLWEKRFSPRNLESN